MNTGYCIGAQDSRLVTKPQHVTCADATPGRVVPAIQQRLPLHLPWARNTQWWHSWCHVIYQATVAPSCVCTVGSVENEGTLQWRESGTSLRTGTRDKWGKVRKEEYCVRKVKGENDENFLLTANGPTLKQYPRSSLSSEVCFLFLFALEI